jgi:hypothetical protein
MLTSLLLSLVILPLQDAPAVEPASPAAAIPTETSESVLAFLKEAEARLYDPQSAGLSSLEFDLALEHPQAGKLGSAHVTWSTTAGVAVDVSAAEGSPVPAAVAEGLGQQMGSQMIGAMLNRPITPMLESGVAWMNGVEDGLVKVAFRNAEAASQGIKEQSLYFDDDGMLQRMLVVQEVQGTSVRISQTFAWRPVAEGSDRCVAAGQHSDTTVDTPMGPMKVPGDTTFTYITVGEIVLPGSISITQSVPVQGAVTQTITATNLKVNGQAVGA